MNSIGMASITAFYNLHREDMRKHTLPALASRAIVLEASEGFTACWPLCTPNRCPILFRYLTHNDLREVSIPERPDHHVDGYGS